MYTAALFASILAGSALALHPVEHLMRRQTLTNDIIPSQCQDTCTSSLPIYNACLSGDQSTCLTVCDSANFDPFVNCFNCIIQNAPGASSGDFQQAQQLIGQLEEACGQAGSSVSGSLETGSASASATGAGASFTSATSGVTIGGGSSSAGGLASITSSVGAAASSASSAIAGGASSAASGASSAASPSASGGSAGNGGFVNAPNGIAALLLGAVGALAL